MPLSPRSTTVVDKVPESMMPNDLRWPGILVPGRSWRMIGLGVALFVTGAMAAPRNPSDAGPPPPAKPFVQAFCDTLIRQTITGRPQAHRHFVTTQLAALIETAQRLSNAAQAATGEKPPLGDGVPWKSVPDYANQCILRSVTRSHAQAMLTVEYLLVNQSQGLPGWKDTLVLTDREGPWRIDNVIYGANHGNLRAVLDNAISESRGILMRWQRAQ